MPPPVPRGFSTLSIRARAPFPCFLVEKRSWRFRARSAPHDAAGRTSGSRHRSMRDGTARCVKAKLHRDRVFRRQPSFASNHRRPFDGARRSGLVFAWHVSSRTWFSPLARSRIRRLALVGCAPPRSPHRGKDRRQRCGATCAVHKARSTPRALRFGAPRSVFSPLLENIVLVPRSARVRIRRLALVGRAREVTAPRQGSTRPV